MKKLTKKEEAIMNLFWENGELFVRELRELYPEPKPHFNTLSTQVRRLESYGYIGHKEFGPTYQYYALVSREDYTNTSLSSIIDRFFGNSYMNVVSALVEEKKISVGELEELIQMAKDVESKS